MSRLTAEKIKELKALLDHRWFGDFLRAIEFPALLAAVEERDRLKAALISITEVAGNLPDDALTDRTGPNDAAARGFMVCHARDIARAALAATKGNAAPLTPVEDKK